MNPLRLDRITFSRKCGIDPAIFVLYWVYSKTKESPPNADENRIFDIDGTLIDMQSKRITEKTLEALQRLRAGGVKSAWRPGVPLWRCRCSRGWNLTPT